MDSSSRTSSDPMSDVLYDSCIACNYTYAGLYFIRARGHFIGDSCGDTAADLTCFLKGRIAPVLLCFV